MCIYLLLLIICNPNEMLGIWLKFQWVIKQVTPSPIIIICKPHQMSQFFKMKWRTNKKMRKKYNYFILLINNLSFVMVCYAMNWLSTFGHWLPLMVGVANYPIDETKRFFLYMDMKAYTFVRRKKKTEKFDWILFEANKNNRVIDS